MNPRLNIIAILLFITACYKPGPEIEYFSIRNDWTTLPVEVSGNFNSNTLLIHLEAYNSSAYQEDIFEDLKNYYTFISFEFNRCFGLGNRCEKAEYTTQHVIDDINLLIKVLFERYGEDINIFLFGRGIGASLTLQYANEGKHKESVNGIIANNALISFEDAAKAFKLKLIELLNSKVDVDIVKLFLEEFENMPIDDITSIEGFYDFLSNDFFELWNDGLIKDINLFSGCDEFENYFAYNTIRNDYYRYINFRDLFLDGDFDIEVDILENISEIDVPVSLIWQKDALIVPLSVGEKIFELLETPDKELHVFDDPCIPYFDETGEYTQTVIEFIEKYK